MPDLAIKVVVIVAYLLVLAGVGWYSYRFTGSDPVSYFLAGRGLGTLVLTFTMLATLMSAFTFLGVPADAYTHGLGIFLGVGVTDAFISVLFFVLGYRLWLASNRFGFVTPSEFFSHRFDSPLLGVLYSVSALLFTAPYISIQIIGGGHAIESLTGGAVPYLPAAVAMAVVISVYVLQGGMRAVAWTDTVQGLLMLVGMIVGFVAIALALGDGTTAGDNGLEAWLSLPGPTGRWSWKGLVGYQLLIFMAVPLFPQVFQRYYTARNLGVFKRAMVIWPVLVVVLFLPAALIGVWGRLVFPELESADAIMPLMVDSFLPGPLAAIVITATLAALMSTADSQLLTSSSLFTRDIYARYVRPDASESQQAWVGRVTVVVIALASFAIAVNPPGLITAIATWSFQGSAMLFPILIAGLYWPGCSRSGAVAGALVSTGLTIGWLTQLLPAGWTFGWIPVIPAALAGTLVMIVVSLFTEPPSKQVTAYYGELWG